jgi:hypothetical protein
MSATNAPALIARAGCPGAGFVLWHSLIRPPNTVAHELNDTAINTNAATRNNGFLISIFN